MGGQKSPFPPPAGGLGRLQLRFRKDYLISVSKTHTLVSIYCLKTKSRYKGRYKEGCVSPHVLFKRKGGNERAHGESGKGKRRNKRL